MVGTVPARASARAPHRDRRAGARAGVRSSIQGILGGRVREAAGSCRRSAARVDANAEQARPGMAWVVVRNAGRNSPLYRLLSEARIANDETFRKNSSDAIHRVLGKIIGFPAVPDATNG